MGGAWALCGVLALAASCGSAKPERPTVQASGDTVRIDLAPIAPASGRFFSYRTDAGGRVDLFVYRESSGEARAVLDACSDCYRWHKGYRLEDGTLVCVKCGMRFSIDELRDGIGGCVPVALPSTRSGDLLEIPVAALEAGARYF
jgi:uncharacterized membrane protein